MLSPFTFVFLLVFLFRFLSQKTRPGFGTEDLDADQEIRPMSPVLQQNAVQLRSSPLHTACFEHISAKKQSSKFFSRIAALTVSEKEDFCSLSTQCCCCFPVFAVQHLEQVAPAFTKTVLRFFVY